MNQATFNKLGELASDGQGLSEEWEIDRWSLRVKTFLQTTLGISEASDFGDLHGSDPWETLALRVGRLEGLLAAEGSGDLQKLSSSKPLVPNEGRKVFVVHGHDGAAKDAVARFIEKVGLQPIILHEHANEGRTIIEKFETYSSDIVFAVVLLTPDDMGCAAGSQIDVSQLGPRARQNVILELGYFIGRLGRTRVCALHKGNVELPSDYQGVLYVPLDEGGAWKAKLAQEFVQAKISIELKGLLGG